MGINCPECRHDNRTSVGYEDNGNTNVQECNNCGNTFRVMDTPDGYEIHPDDSGTESE